MSDVYMYDGISALAAGIAREFPNAAKVAGYVSGTYEWSSADWGLFPHADHVKVATSASVNDGDVLDVERGDATPEQSAGWIAMRKAAGLFRPTVYCSLDTVPAVRLGTGSYVLGRDYDLWVAHFTGQPHQAYPGCAATQYESTANWDVSLVHDAGWPHRTPPVAPGLPAPAGLSVTPWTELHMSWTPVDGVKLYHYEVQRDGEVITSGVVPIPRASDTIAPGPCQVRVQADGGTWSPWHQVG